MKRLEIQKLVNNEHGINFHRNVNLSGYTAYRNDSFITFHFVKINNMNTVFIDYVYLTGKRDLIKLLSFCIDFWDGHQVKFIYYKEHRRDANYVKKYFKALGFNIVEEERPYAWKHSWTSLNGYKEGDILEAFL